MIQPIPHADSPVTSQNILPEEVIFIRVSQGECFDVKMQYPILGMACAEEGCYMRKPVYEMLKKAASLLPASYRLRVWDAWRPLALQKELYEVYRQAIIDTFNLAALSESEQKAIISGYVSIPSENPLLAPAHTTGGALDVTLIDEKGNELDMGTLFDDFSEKAATDYFEKPEYDGSEIQKNRRILYNAMTKAGFTNLPSEWWHYDYGNALWSYYSGKPAIFTGIFDKSGITSEED